MNDKKFKQNISVDDFEDFKINNDPLCFNNCQKAKSADFLDNFDTKDKSSQISASDFKISIVLNENTFRSLVLTEHKKTGRIYVAKVFKKKKIVKYNLMKRIMNEKRILESIDFPFVVHLEYFYQDRDFIYLVMPFVSGGNLDMYIKRYGKMDEDKARFYLSEIILAVEYLHKLDLCHRDIKPHNIMIDIQGHVQLTDFGLCKHITRHTYSFCGTLEYMAPEILHRQGHGKSVDFWSMGVTLYELIAGHSPFLNVDPSTMYKNILNAQYNCPLGFSGNLINLLRNMLRVDVTRRYGNLVNGFQDIKKHRWFHATDWCALFNKQITPPFVPTIFDAQDIGNFKNQRSDKTFLQSTSETNLYDEEFKDF